MEIVLLLVGVVFGIYIEKFVDSGETKKIPQNKKTTKVDRELKSEELELQWQELFAYEGVKAKKVKEEIDCEWVNYAG